MKRTPTLTVYLDAAGLWRWRLQAANSRIVADGSEGYVDRRGALRAAGALARAVKRAVVRVV